MSKTRWVLLAFWLVVIVGIAKSVYDFDSSQKAEAQAHPTPKEFFFTPTATQPATPSASATAPAGANVQQVDFEVQDDTPIPGNFTCVVTVKNIGTAKAQNIQVRVRPYKGSRTGSDDVGHDPVRMIKDTDPLAQIDGWLGFPDLAPGESSTQSITFPTRNEVDPGHNPSPEISFDSAKTQP